VRHYPNGTVVNGHYAAFPRGGKVVLVRLRDDKQFSYASDAFALSGTGLWLSGARTLRRVLL
jgi:hypothetical protein